VTICHDNLESLENFKGKIYKDSLIEFSLDLGFLVKTTSCDETLLSLVFGRIEFIGD